MNFISHLSPRSLTLSGPLSLSGWPSAFPDSWFPDIILRSRELSSDLPFGKGLFLPAKLSGSVISKFRCQCNADSVASIMPDSVASLSVPFCVGPTNVRCYGRCDVPCLQYMQLVIRKVFTHQVSCNFQHTPHSQTDTSKLNQPWHRNVHHTHSAFQLLRPHTSDQAEHQRPIDLAWLFAPILMSHHMTSPD